MKITADLKGKKALVTGGASGIGLATVEALARCGATVTINDLPGGRLSAEVERLRNLGFDVLAAEGDVGKSDDEVTSMINNAVEAMGGLDYLVNNAATPGVKKTIPESDLDSQNEEFWTKLLSVNLIGSFRCIRAAVPHLKQGSGAIVNVASTAALGGGGSSTVYAATKSGLITVTRELARGLGPEIRVNGIAPGWVKGTGWSCTFEEKAAEEAAKKLPLKRIGTPEDYAEAIFYLCVGAGYVTGQTLVVDGGLLA